MKKKFHPYLKWVSSLLVLTFFLQDVSYAAIDLKPAQFEFFQKPLVNFQIPASVALVEDSYLASSVERIADRKEKEAEGGIHYPLSAKRYPLKYGNKTIFLIQDAHTNESGQRNAAKALEIILKLRGSNKTRHSELRRSEESHLGDEILRRFAPQDDGGIKYVFLEAGTGDDSLSSIRARASLEKRK